MVGCGRSWKKLLEFSPELGQCLPCAVTCSSLANHEICTQQQDANSAETVLVCREVWLLWWARLTWEELHLVMCGAATSVPQRQSLCFWSFAGQWFRMSAFSTLKDLLILSQGKEGKWSETNRWLEAQWNYFNQITKKSAAVSPTVSMKSGVTWTRDRCLLLFVNFIVSVRTTVVNDWCRVCLQDDTLQNIRMICVVPCVFTEALLNVLHL